MWIKVLGGIRATRLSDVTETDSDDLLLDIAIAGQVVIITQSTTRPPTTLMRTTLPQRF
jgi:hypothetical protein